ncbi:MAG: hypothetical protein KC616_14730 [Myxococcales bacterium]|nr:hypothetical protein [Myxococcales bacterium]
MSDLGRLGFGSCARGGFVGGVLFLLLAVVLGFPSAGYAADPDGGEAGGERGPTPLYVPGASPGPARDASTVRGGAMEPELEDLLQLPSDFVIERSRPVAGATENEWRRRFEKAAEELSEARDQLAATKRELDAVAETGGASQWSVAPPGAGGGNSTPTNSPLSFKLRQELQRNRERVEAATRGLRELRIEADLAGVPVSWRAEAPGGPAESLD